MVLVSRAQAMVLVPRAQAMVCVLLSKEPTKTNICSFIY
jgi:hypothetical protein